jgi:SAM-dependent MidA family methyltransferase
MATLQAIVSEKIIAAGGAITFADYMSEVLYHPTLGYYNRMDMTIGERGDFYTSPMVHPIFGHCVARQIRDIWKQMGSPDPFVILEMGAGTGALARDLLDEWDRLQQLKDRHDPIIGQQQANPVGKTIALRYLIVEQSPILRDKQAETTSEIARERIEWYSTLQEIHDYGSLLGVIVSNELFDALPVHRLTFENGRLQERYVTLSDLPGEDEPSFAEVTGPLSDDGLVSIFPDEMLNLMEEGDRFEVSLQWGTVIRQMAAALKEGSIITIDYGDTAPEVYWTHAKKGGIRCCYKQALVTDPYVRVGLQDLTADADFSYLQRTGEAVGFTTTWFSNQSEFLEKFGFLDKVTELQRMAFKDLRADFEMQRMLTLYLPQNGLGGLCKVLVQQKAANAE